MPRKHSKKPSDPLTAALSLKRGRGLDPLTKGRGRGPEGKRGTGQTPLAAALQAG